MYRDQRLQRETIEMPPYSSMDATTNYRWAI